MRTTEDIEMVEDICWRLRETAKEFGKQAIAYASIIGPNDIGQRVGGVPYIVCPTLGHAKMANVDWKVARFFEDLQVGE